MSANNIETEASDICCASCGIAEVDDIKLKECDVCDLVRYCGDKCQLDHRPEHKTSCKERSAEIRDEILFKQPESSHLGHCPICYLPLSLDIEKSVLQTCCSKVICNGCAYAIKIRQMDKSLDASCPFCRHQTPKSREEEKAIFMKRAATNDSVEVLKEIGIKNYHDGDDEGALKCMTKAAELGDAESYYGLSFFYQEGKVVTKDEEKRLHYLEEASIRGHPEARYDLACINDVIDSDRSVKHLIIAASLGHNSSIKLLRVCYENGLMSKADFATALRAHQAAIDATKSSQRELAAEYYAKEMKQSVKDGRLNCVTSFSSSGSSKGAF